MKRPDESFPRVDDPIDLGSRPDPDHPKGTHPIFHLPSHRVAERILGSYCRTLPRRRYIVNIFLLKTRLLLQKKRCVRNSFEGSWWTLQNSTSCQYKRPITYKCAGKNMVRTASDKQISRTFQGFFKDKLQFSRTKIYLINWLSLTP